MLLSVLGRRASRSGQPRQPTEDRVYSVDNQDTVSERKDVPQSSVGAPCPIVVAGEHFLHLAYFLEESEEGWDGSSVQIVTEQSEDEPCALVRFERAYAHMFGPPNDEAFKGHPLAERGLHPYGVFEIENSSWIRRLKKMNSIHPYHRLEEFEKYKHFVFAFHDCTFECVARSFKLSIHRGSASSVLRDSWPNE